MLSELVNVALAMPPRSFNHFAQDYNLFSLPKLLLRKVLKIILLQVEYEIKRDYNAGNVETTRKGETMAAYESELEGISVERGDGRMVVTYADHDNPAMTRLKLDMQPDVSRVWQHLLERSNPYFGKCLAEVLEYMLAAFSLRSLCLFVEERDEVIAMEMEEFLDQGMRVLQDRLRAMARKVGVEPQESSDNSK
jgi:hypothetical protein